jgi:hypothetical protein
MKSVIVGAHLRAEDIEPEARALAAGDVFLSGVDVADDQPLGDRELLLRVAKVRAALLERATFIAIRYGFAVHGAEEAAAKVAPHAQRWRALLEANRDHVEMTLKVIARNPRPRPDRRDFATGADYLRALHESTHAGEVDARFRDAVSRLGTHRWTHRDGRSLECALLVRRAEVPRVSEAGEQLRREFPDVAFLLSGPWPLEVFADADRE